MSYRAPVAPRTPGGQSIQGLTWISAGRMALGPKWLHMLSRTHEPAKSGRVAIGTGFCPFESPPGVYGKPYGGICPGPVG